MDRAAFTLLPEPATGRAGAEALPLAALMLQRAAARQDAAARSALLGAALVGAAHWNGPGAGLLPWFLALRLMLFAHGWWLGRRLRALDGQAAQAAALEPRFVLGLAASGATWGLVGWMVPNMDLVHWSARDVFSCLVLVYVSSMMLITAAHSPRGMVAHIGALWGVAVLPAAFQREALQESLVILVAVAGLLVTTLGYGRMLVRQTRRGVLAELEREQLTLNLRRVNGELEQALRQATQAASRDSLTGLLNRRALHARADYIAASRRREPGPCTVMLLDLDHFKRINDLHGHAAGDAVLMAIAATLQGELREVDVVARWGGEEFLVLMPDCAVEAAMARAEQVRVAVGRTLVAALPAGYALSVSIGVAEWPLAGDLVDAVRRADAALYRAKAAGRDRVTAAA
ncbi:diguanylate cyclase [Pelomonas sp. KK5]|uniref:GGDEF domain-containing protein n=1 Tax=Pelomonas sp. KK5 TaxID=1855730 RepID=UPI00097BFEEF|nr:diguanylate cyclase [Pelomonas sp. KK5]